MDISLTLRHFFMPGYSNNHKAKLLHNSSLICVALFLVAVRALLSVLSSPHVAVLGYAANISPQRVIELTNRERLKTGVAEVSYNEELSRAATLKAKDMLAQGYWAHVAPDGTEPWDFFRTVGYSYRYAGENLARDFSSPEGAIEAWLASPTHRENMLSGKYTEIGVAVVEGNLNGQDATLIVQLFGTPSTADPSVPVVSAETSKIPPAESEFEPEPVPVVLARTPDYEPIIEGSSFDVMRTVTMVVVASLVGILAADVIVIARRGITRAGGRAFAHLSFMAMVLIILVLVRAGEII